MAGASLLALLDDIATVLDDVSVMTKIAAKKTAGVLGDDLALNAEQVSGVRARRELPVVWAVAKGSFKNKLILVPAALLLSALLPWLIVPLLMCGGLYLCYEGMEKVAHKLLHRHEEQADKAELVQAFEASATDLVAFERKKIKGAIRTDFILSAEIIVIALGTVSGEPFIEQVIVVSLIAAVMTAGVYGFVALIVKLDDIGLYLLDNTGPGLGACIGRGVGRGLLWLCPWLMKTLTAVGTAAMFLVGGGILLHGIPPLAHLVEEWLGTGTAITVTTSLVMGLIAGLLTLLVISGGKKLLKRD